MSQEAAIIAACVTGGGLMVYAISKLAFTISKSGWFATLSLEERTFGPMVVLLDKTMAPKMHAEQERQRWKLARMAVEDARLVQVWGRDT